MISVYTLGQLETYVYIISKGCKDLALITLVNRPDSGLKEHLHKWAESINSLTDWTVTGGRDTKVRVTFTQKYATVTIYAKERENVVLPELDEVLNTDMSSEEYYRRLGLVLGYRPDLVEKFVEINKNR